MILTHKDHRTIKHAIEWRLEHERGVDFLEVKVSNKPNDEAPEYIKVKVIIVADDHAIRLRSYFDLPPEFDKAQLLNEIDEIASAIKTARVTKMFAPPTPTPIIHHIPGTGRRGRWKKSEDANGTPQEG